MTLRAVACVFGADQAAEHILIIMQHLVFHVFFSKVSSFHTAQRLTCRVTLGTLPLL